MNVQLLGSLAYLVALTGADLFLLFGPPAAGMEGAGYGAAAAQWAGAIVVCLLLNRKQVWEDERAMVVPLQGRPCRVAWCPPGARPFVQTAPFLRWLQIFDPRDMATLPTLIDALPYTRMSGSLAVNNLSALLPTLVATTAATSLGVEVLGAHTILRQLMGFWLQVGRLLKPWALSFHSERPMDMCCLLVCSSR
jgi:hypothetical protein